ncbi:MAG: GWxTD domain-containing protein [Cryomorphaceae bacterium]|nr:GWxTD domain-containing protein [Cryomorphaceae bacterium]
MMADFESYFLTFATLLSCRIMNTMRTILLLLFFSLPILVSASLKATFDLKHFLVPGENPYIETHLLIDGGTSVYAQLDSIWYQSTIATTVIIHKDGKVVDFRKININSPRIHNDEIADIIDIQRFLLEPGEYYLELELIDINNTDEEPLVLFQEFTLELNNATAGVSDITFLSGYSKSTNPTDLTKSGYDLLPYISDHFPEEANKLVFYAEVYNTDVLFDATSQYLLTYYIESDAGIATNTQRFLRETPKTVRPLLESIDISNLKSGAYVLKIEIRNRENELMAENGIMFFRTSQQSDEPAKMSASTAFSPHFMDFGNPDSINDYLLCLYPIASGIEFQTIEKLVANGDMTTKQNYFYHFWENQNIAEPMPAWQRYAIEVQYVKRKYSSPVLPGYLTDRGRVFLKYGKPNTIVIRHNEVDVYPFEIWHYYKIGKFNNKRFLFYSRSVSTIDFELLHSDMYGELQNEDWQYIMRAKNNDLRPTDSGVNRSNPQDTFSGDELEDLFYNPR